MTPKSNLLIATSAVLLAGVLSVRVSSHPIPTRTVAATTPMQASSTYVGSAACRRCHTATYDRWSKTRMANVVHRSEGAP
jgi:hypothetical protein